MGIFRSIENFGNKVALISPDKGTFTYSQLLAETFILKNYIQGNSFILLVCSNSIETFISYIFALKNNCTIMLIDSKMRVGDINAVISAYNHDVIIGPEDVLKTLKVQKAESIKKFFDYGVLNLKTIRKRPFNKNICLLLPTSGSMGSRKFVIISKDNLCANTYSIIKFLGITTKDRAVTTMPFSYTYMLSIVNTHLEVGASILVTDKSLFTRGFWDDYLKHQITSFSGVPYIYQILKKLSLEKIFSTSLNVITQAGGKLRYEIASELVKLAKQHGVKFVSMYGQTEATSRISYLDPKFCDTKLGSIGKPIPKGKMWLENDNFEVITTAGHRGELVYKGPNVSWGYSHDYNDLSIPDQNNETLRTGDLAYFDKDGFFYLDGRLKRIAKIFGIRLNLDELEEKMFDEGFLVVCLEAEEKVDVFFEMEYCLDELLNSLVKITRQNRKGFLCVKISRFPRTVSGKINYNDLRKEQNEFRL